MHSLFRAHRIGVNLNSEDLSKLAPENVISASCLLPKDPSECFQNPAQRGLGPFLGSTSEGPHCNHLQDMPLQLASCQMVKGTRVWQEDALREPLPAKTLALTNLVCSLAECVLNSEDEEGCFYNPLLHCYGPTSSRSKECLSCTV